MFFAPPVILINLELLLLGSCGCFKQGTEFEQTETVYKKESDQAAFGYPPNHGGHSGAVYLIGQEMMMKWMNGWRKMFRLGLIFTLILFSGFVVGCADGSDTKKVQTEAGAPAETDPLKEKSWDKLVWDTGKWG